MVEPILYRKFQFTDLAGNNNKWWEIKHFADGTMTTTWGRVGTAGQSKTFPHTSGGRVNEKIYEKLDKGYVEVELHKPAQVQAAPAPGIAPTADPYVQGFVNYIMQEAGQHIKTYLAVGVDALSVNQLQKGRIMLTQIQAYGPVTGRVDQSLVQRVESYLNTIPTKLPARIDIHDVVMNFLNDLHEQEDRLNQLEAALASYQAASDPQQATVQTALGGVNISTLAQNSAAYATIADYIARTSGGRRKIHNIFGVEIPKERIAFDNETFGKHSVASLFHGTRNPNVHHILRSGLIIPGTAANGSRFGRGIYFANMAKRSLNYCGGNGNLNVLFINDVALGTPAVMKGDDSSLRQAPNGYHSVWGKESYSGMDEFIVFKPSQQTIRAIVTIE